MRVFKLALIMGLALGSAASIADECAAPDSPSLPDGSTASMEQMLAGQKAVKAFQAANSEYRTCLEPQIGAAETDSLADSSSSEIEDKLKQLNDNYNASVSNEEELAGQFNAELQKFKAANPS